MADQLHPAFSFPDSQRSQFRLDQRHLKRQRRFCTFTEGTVKKLLQAGVLVAIPDHAGLFF